MNEGHQWNLERAARFNRALGGSSLSIQYREHLTQANRPSKRPWHLVDSSAIGTEKCQTFTSPLGAYKRAIAVRALARRKGGPRG